jgi:cyclohexadienyl dehydratase
VKRFVRLLPGLFAVIVAATAGHAETLRVGVSGDYPPFSFPAADEPTEYRGLDVAIAKAYASDRNRALEIVRFRWPELLPDLANDRFDLAMSGITIRPERSVAGIFGVPVMASGAVVLVRVTSGFKGLESLDDPSARIAVNAGGHLERVTRVHFPSALIRAIPDNAAVRGALLSSSVDAVVTDTLEAPLWRRGIQGIAQLGPFTNDLKAPLVHPERQALAADLDEWLMAREADGTLAALRQRYLGHGDAPTTAQPLTALLAAVAERLDLMPLVAEAKRRAGIPIEAPEREQRVIRDALAAAREAAEAAGRKPFPEADLRRFFAVQIEAAKQIQRTTLAAPPGKLPELDLDTALRPVLLRLGRRIVWLAQKLPPQIERSDLEERARERLQTPGLTDAVRDEMVNAIFELAEARRDQR